MRIKNYLSYSQYSCFLGSPTQYEKRYIEGIKLNSKYLDFGKKVAKSLENRKYKNKDDVDKQVVKLIKKCDYSEFKLLVDFYKIPLLGFLDGYNKNPSEIKEYKTGKIPWTQNKVDNAEQLTFYAIMVSKHFKIPIDKIKIKLIWLETLEDTDGKIILTGRKEVFITKRTRIDELKIYPKIKRVWVGIEDLINKLI